MQFSSFVVVCQLGIKTLGIHIASKSLRGKFLFAFSSSWTLQMMTYTEHYKRDKGLGSIRAIFGLIFKITLIMSNDTTELVSLKNENNF